MGKAYALVIFLEDSSHKTGNCDKPCMPP